MNNTLNVTTAGDRELVVVREFDAPRNLVWRAMNKPDLLKRWLTGPPGWEMTVCEDDAREGGSFRWEWSGPDAAKLVMTGVYQEYLPPDRCVRTERFEMVGGPPMGEQLATLELVETAGRTKLTVRIAFPSPEARAGAMASGMTEGMAAGYDGLEALLATLPA